MSIYDFVIMGGGSYGMTIAKLLKNKIPTSKILLIEKKKLNDFKNDSIFSLPIRSKGLNLNKHNNELIAKGYQSLKNYCDENKINFKNIGELIISNHKIEKERMNNLQQIQSLKKISLIHAKELEPLLNEKNLEMADFYHLESSALIDYNKLLKIKLEDLKNYSDLDLFHNSQVLSVFNKKEEFEIETKNLENGKNEKFTSKVLINATGSESLKLAHQINELKEYSYLNIFSNQYHGNIPAKIKYPNKIISSTPFVIHPGLSFYSDEFENKTIGPIFTTTNSSYSFIKKIKTLNEWRKVYEIFYRNNQDPQMEYKYNSKTYVSLFYLNIFGFQMPKLLNKNNKIDYENSLVFLPEKKQILENVIIHKNQNFLSLANYDLHGGLEKCHPICDELVNLI